MNYSSATFGKKTIDRNDKKIFTIFSDDVDLIMAKDGQQERKEAMKILMDKLLSRTTRSVTNALRLFENALEKRGMRISAKYLISFYSFSVIAL